MSINVATTSVEVWDASYQKLSVTNLGRALSLVLSGRAVVHEEDPVRVIRSVGGEVMKVPLIIRLLQMANVKIIYAPEYFSKQGVLKRDNYKCAYCGKHGDTHDHVFPKSRGGKDSWENSVTACKKCNGKKDNRTPQEAGMTLLYQPYTPMRYYFQSKNPNKRRPRKRRK